MLIKKMNFAGAKSLNKPLFIHGNMVVLLNETIVSDFMVIN